MLMNFKEREKTDFRIKLKDNKYICFVSELTNRFASAFTSQSETHSNFNE